MIICIFTTLRNINDQANEHFSSFDFCDRNFIPEEHKQIILEISPSVMTIYIAICLYLDILNILLFYCLLLRRIFFFFKGAIYWNRRNKKWVEVGKKEFDKPKWAVGFSKIEQKKNGRQFLLFQLRIKV